MVMSTERRNNKQFCQEKEESEVAAAAAYLGN
jgi:hypothetical protein